MPIIHTIFQNAEINLTINIIIIIVTLSLLYTQPSHIKLFHYKIYLQLTETTILYILNH